MFISITKDIDKKRLVMRYGENHQLLVSANYIKEIKDIENFNTFKEIHQKMFLRDLLTTFAIHSKIPFKKPNDKNAIAWITKNVKHIKLIGFGEKDYFTKHISKNIAGKNCLVTWEL